MPTLEVSLAVVWPLLASHALPRSIQNKSSECFVKVGSCTIARNITINKTEPGPHLQGPFSAVREKSGYQMTTQASLTHLALEMRMFYLLQQSKNLISLMSMCVCGGAADAVKALLLKSAP